MMDSLHLRAVLTMTCMSPVACARRCGKSEVFEGEKPSEVYLMAIKAGWTHKPNSLGRYIARCPACTVLHHEFGALIRTPPFSRN